MNYNENGREFPTLSTFKIRTVNKCLNTYFCVDSIPCYASRQSNYATFIIIDRFSEPETLKMAKLGRELRAKGFDVIDLSLGEPDFDTPQHIKDAAKKAIDDNWSHYPPVAGYLDLREAVCHKFKRDNNLVINLKILLFQQVPNKVLPMLYLALVEEGDEVIIPTPFWVTYQALVQIAGADPKIVRTSFANGYKITPEELEEAITPEHKAFYVFFSM